MKVKNSSYIINLARRILHANKNRRNILLVSIALTCILFTSLFSVAIGIGKSMELQTMKSVGTISHGSFKELSDDDIEVLSKDPDIKDYSVRKKVGLLDHKKISAELSFIDEKGIAWSLVDNVKGHLPEKEDEVFIDIATAKKLGYEGKIGEKIQIPFTIEKPYTGEVLAYKVQDFTVSGTFEAAIDSNVGVGQIYLSKDYADKLNLLGKPNDMEVMFNNSWKIKDKLLKVAERNGYKVLDSPGNLKDKEIRIGVNFAYLFSGSGGFDYQIFLPAVLLLLLVFLAGFLIINNVFKIAINEDIKLFGFLKTIGMTRPQIKKLVHLESLLVAFPSIIIGNILGVFIGRTILHKIFSTNMMLATIKLSASSLVIIILFSMVFTLITVFLSVMAPARYASKVSPIDASRYNEVEIKNKYKSDTISLGKLARRQVFSNKFRFFSILLSMSLSAVILNSVLTYTGNIDLEKGLSDIITTDYNVASPRYFRYMYYNSSEDSLPLNYIDEIRHHEGFKNGGALYSYGAEYAYPSVKIKEKRLSPLLLAMDDYILSKQSFVEGEFDKAKWETNDYVLVGEDIDGKSAFKLGDTLTIDFKGKVKKVQVMGKINYNFSNGLRYYTVIHENEDDVTSPVLDLEYIYMTPALYQEITGDMSVMSYGFDVEEDKKDGFDELLKSFENNPDFAYDSRDLQIESFKEYKNLIKFVGYCLSLVLFLISVLNFINIIATEILKNMVNLAILEAIGMTKKNMKSYLIKKNLTYSMASLVFSFMMMLILNKLILIDFITTTRWTSFKFVILPLVMVNLVNIIIGILFTSKFYENHSQNALVDRIRSLE